ncbi:hypothetical protein EVAR_21290_1 [Eumeta japonica]|uniref:Uncharacterized protein n=1 Tax=Eumeta variegata TaxID=151549 RepID=A0A4C1WPB2_EUMVA|nr:hypothetical protein EVAR_21290_1 [Eumeta japonica]
MRLTIVRPRRDYPRVRAPRPAEAGASLQCPLCTFKYCHRRIPYIQRKFRKRYSRARAAHRSAHAQNAVTTPRAMLGEKCAHRSVRPLALMDTSDMRERYRRSVCKALLTQSTEYIMPRPVSPTFACRPSGACAGAARSGYSALTRYWLALRVKRSRHGDCFDLLALNKFTFHIC